MRHKEAIFSACADNNSSAGPSAWLLATTQSCLLCHHVVVRFAVDLLRCLPARYSASRDMSLRHFTHTHFCVVTVDRDLSLSFNDRVSVICFQKYTLEDTRDSFGGQGSRSALVSCFRPVDVLCNSCVFMLSVKAAPSLFAPTLK